MRPEARHGAADLAAAPRPQGRDEGLFGRTAGAAADRLGRARRCGDAPEAALDEGAAAESSSSCETSDSENSPPPGASAAANPGSSPRGV